jgi:hypothetical protein
VIHKGPKHPPQPKAQCAPIECARFFSDNRQPIPQFVSLPAIFFLHARVALTKAQSRQNLVVIITHFGRKEKIYFAKKQQFLQKKLACTRKRVFPEKKACIFFVSVL